MKLLAGLCWLMAGYIHTDEMAELASGADGYYVFM